ncbi:unnamed protein product [Cylicocyclus nassatus]|uniref:Uncharacterized protein n=1 Tax=Cylicocyclus nassatus TaxID=53992 RepID=A0AA36H753_CYLNA|nr:unnamed protein product [Cylicocyclus nassatus]
MRGRNVPVLRRILAGMLSKGKTRYDDFPERDQLLLDVSRQDDARYQKLLGNDLMALTALAVPFCMSKVSNKGTIPT